jgi:hypothetical protein
MRHTVTLTLGPLSGPLLKQKYDLLVQRILRDASALFDDANQGEWLLECEVRMELVLAPRSTTAKEAARNYMERAAAKTVS